MNLFYSNLNKFFLFEKLTNINNLAKPYYKL